MKTFRLIAAGFFFAAIFAVSTFAQTAAAGAGKIAVIDTGAFGVAKEGINKYITAQTTLDNEFKPVQTELQGMVTRIQALEAELKKLQQASQNPSVPAAGGAASFQTKYEEYEKMGREYKFKEEDAKTRYERRRGVVLGPISQDISKAMQEFAKQKGYTMILDGGRLFENGFILAMGDEKVDVTKEFITFYNARPAGTASAATK